jgi:hypothetical protein
MGKFQVSPELAMINNNLMAAINQLKEQLSFTTLMIDSLIESMGEDKVDFVNRSINKKIYINLLESKKFNDNRELRPNEPLDAKLVQGAKLQEQIDLLRNDLIDKFGIGLVKEAEDREEKPTWVKGNLIKI